MSQPKVHAMPRECYDAVLDALLDSKVPNADLVARLAVTSYENALRDLPAEQVRVFTLLGALRREGDELVPVAERFRLLGAEVEWAY